MVTGDLNAALVEWVVQYRIEDPENNLSMCRNRAETLRDLSEAAMREVIGDRTVDELITIGEDVEIEALARDTDLQSGTNSAFAPHQPQVRLEECQPSPPVPGISTR